MSRLTYPLERINRWDYALCLRFNRVSRVSWIRIVFRAVSRLGDGLFWYALMLSLLAWDGIGALAFVAHMLLAGFVCTALYKWLKGKTLRPRPFQTNPDIVCSAAPLDKFSFPSGHTLHAVAFSVIAIAYYPGLIWLVAPFTLLVSMSRLVLGLHYPSDVLAGALIGAAIAAVSFGF